ncbi:proteasome activator [Ornithinicoccus hortensis]|uniref:Bacterial proteasome activator n=1 Tax=Ornithinicoccus hortensis TaxID=82346 RepID=A0A542YM65_9MICO|nr:proteasome activator [Ornithinicoccus hortensis]TQL49131.1 uncharacterized protein DUF2587 [Ornithinicoccus hortensis]
MTDRPEQQDGAPEHEESGQGGAPQDQGQADQTQEGGGGRVVVVTPDGMGVAEASPPEGADGAAAGGDGDGRRRHNPAEMVEQPAKVMRLGTMIKQLLDEVKSAPLDDAGRQRLAEIHRRSITELEQGLSQELVEELERITLPLTEEAPSEAELRIAQAQLVGWLEGLFHGIQTAIVAQQMAAQQQLQQMRRALPGGQQLVPGQAVPGQFPGMPGTGRPAGDDEDAGPTGQYL